MSAINLECPRCGHGIPSDDKIGQYPGAMSRFSSDIEVCSACGGDEALLQLKAMSKGKDEVSRIVHPVFGDKLWVNPAPWF